MTAQLVYSGTLDIVTCWCGMRHAVPLELREYQLRQHRDGQVAISIYCPLGHGHVPSGLGEAARLRKELEVERNVLARERARHDQTEAELRATEHRRRAEKAAKTRIKNRVANGVCPCCKRTFQNLAQHMAGQHPGWRGGGVVKHDHVWQQDGGASSANDGMSCQICGKMQEFTWPYVLWFPGIILGIAAFVVFAYYLTKWTR